MMSTSAMSAVAGKMKGPSTQVQTTYGVFTGLSLAVYYLVANGEFSAILTLSVLLQCLGFALLSVHTLSKGTAQGISARALGLDALALVCRLSSTTWLHGYLPVDASGDFVFQAVDFVALATVCWLLHRVLVDKRDSYQAVDFVSLATVCWLLHRVLVDKRDSYQEEDDSCAVLPMVLASFILAAILHADMNARPLFDALWMAGLFISVFAVLPQLWLIFKNRGRVEALTSHYIAAMALSRMMSGIFMWYARHDITCATYVNGVNHAIWAILSAHFIHMLLLGDFAYYYIKAIINGDISSGIALGDDFV